MKVLTTVKNLINEEKIDFFRSKGIEVIEVEKDRFKEAHYNDFLNNAHIIVGGEELNSLKVEQFPKLKLIQLISAGYDFLQMETKLQKRVKISNATGIYSIPIAEWVIGQTLLSYKRYYNFKESQDNKIWNPDFRLQELNEKKVIVFGTGSIGLEICKRFNAFNCVVDGVNSNGRLINGFNQCYSLLESPPHIKNYDILVFALPSNTSTKNFLNASVLKHISENSILINVGRGDLINEKDLIAVLDDQKGVVVYLDVHNIEPLPKNSALWSHPQIFVTPHTSFSSTHNMERLRDLVANNILNVKNNANIINEVLTGDKHDI